MNKTLVLSAGFAALVSQIGQAQSMPPVRQLGPVTSVAKDPLGAVTTVRQLPDGRVLVNDIVGRRVVMFDSTLSSVTVVADTTSATTNAYGTRPGGLISYHGDSTLFIDPASLSMLLIDPAGKIVRVMSAPRAEDVGFLVGGPFGNPGFDPQGRLIYRAPPRFNFNGPPPSRNGIPQIPTPPDSAAIVRFDLATRKLDTVTWFKTPKITLNVTKSPDGGIRVLPVVNPLPQADDWAILQNGTVAIVRGRDYHVDLVGAQGTTSLPKIPFEWERLTDEGKVAYLDSAKIAIEKMRASGQFFGFGGVGGSGGATVTRTVEAGPPGGPPRSDVTREGPVATTGGGAAATQLPPITFVLPNELPDYRPAFTPGSTRVDADGNLWVRTSHNVDARPVYDVINQKGELIDRVQLPQNRSLAGFGPSGVVYLAVRDSTTAHLEKARLK